ncbi:MAG: class II fumarate hydratase [Actinomycetota bacterium]|nr:MAG: class II fumarate hydratase [Actinomycetota bacterium]
MDGSAGQDVRVEHDSLGEVRVAAGALWRAQTQRAVENFPISGEPLPSSLLRALALVKSAAAQVNAEHGVLPRDVADAISAAADEIVEGAYPEAFPVDVFQTGSGTSTNMNVNEVVATLAERRLHRPVHANDDVNASQSSNDVFPTAIHVAAVQAVVDRLVPALEHLAHSLRGKAEQYRDAVKPGRTHLVDAAPTTFGAELNGYATSVDHGIARLLATLPRLGELPIGGTAVGTGLNAPKGFGGEVARRLAARTGLPLREARDHAEAAGGRDGLVELSGQLRTVAISLTKICDDLRWMASGPNAGLAEITLPALQPGSSIMPGKVNPVVPEAVIGVCAAVIGNDATVAWSAARGSFELNVVMPVMGRAVLQSVDWLAASVRLLADRCVDGIVADVERMRDLATSSDAVVTPLATRLGYDEASSVVKEARATGQSLRAVVLARGHVDAGRLTDAELDDLLDVRRMARPHDD